MIHSKQLWKMQIFKTILLSFLIIHICSGNRKAKRIRKHSCNSDRDCRRNQYCDRWNIFSKAYILKLETQIFFSENNSYTDVCLTKCQSSFDCENEEQSCYKDGNKPGRCLYPCTWRQRNNCPKNTICDRYENACLKPCKNDNQCPKDTVCFPNGQCLAPCETTSNCFREEYCDRSFILFHFRSYQYFFKFNFF